MKSTKFLAILLSICLIFSFTGCGIINRFTEQQVETPDDSNSVTDIPTTPDDDGNENVGENGNGNNDGNENGDGNNNGTNNGGESNNTPFSINVIMVNDNHGILNEDDGSLDRIATGISYYESLGNVVKIANGDMFQGTYVSSTLRGLPMLEALNELDFDAFVIGNHEFDWGLDEMKKYKDGDLKTERLNFPSLAQI